MADPVSEYYRIKLEKVRKNLERNNFRVFLAENAENAKNLVIDEIAAPAGGGTVSWGGSATLNATGLKDWFVNSSDWDVLTTDAAYTPEKLSTSDKTEIRRQALLSDLYLLGSNAVTEDGALVNLDMIGNRVAALTFGPEKVVVLAGRNKICRTLEDALQRVKEFASQVNNMRLGFKNPCVKTAYCHNCTTEQRICNTWTITEKSFPPGRTTVILINEDLGF